MRRFLLIRFLATHRKLRYWKRYARALEARLEGELWRNREREDSLLSTYVRAGGMYAPESRSAPAKPMIPLSRQAARSPQTSASEWDHLTPEELTEWEIWKEDALTNGANVNMAREKAEFLEKLRFRKSQEM